MRPAIADRDARARFDQKILQSALDGRHLPPYLPTEPNGAGAGAAAADVVPVVLEAIQEAHGLDAWDAEAYERVFLGEAMRAWHGELDVERRPNTLVMRTPTCPVLAQAQRDARVCQMCRALHAAAAQEGYGWRLHGITFTRLITRGEPACEMHVAVAPP